MSLDLCVGGCYSSSDLESSLHLSKFMPHYSFWSDGVDVYSFHHLPLKYLKIKYQLEKVVHTDNPIRYESFDTGLNCCSPMRLGL